MDARSVLPKSSLLSDSGLDEAARRLRSCSPTLLLELFSRRSVDDSSGWVQQLPPITLLHGTSDKTCPYEQSVRFRDVLVRAGVDAQRCALKLYPGKTHTSPIIEDPMSGTDPLITDLLDVVHGIPLRDGEVRRGTRPSADEAHLWWQPHASHTPSPSSSP